MKKASKLVCVLLALMLAIVFGACDNGGDENGEETSEVSVKGSGDWTIAPGYENTVEKSKLKIEGAKEGNNGVLKVTWSSSTDFRSCEFYAQLPENEDWGVYDGITFKVKLPASSNFLLLLRNPDGGTTWKIWEDYVYRGRDDGELAWVTVRKPFSGAVDTGWGPAPAQSTIKAWLTADKGTRKQINLNPVLNVGGGSAVNTDLVTCFDDIGFYKGNDPDNPDSEHFIWTFDVN